MSKADKIMVIPKADDEKRVDPPEQNHTKAHRQKKVYPPHMQVRSYGAAGFWVRPHGIPHLAFWIYYDRWVDRTDLPSIIRWFEGRYPETCDLPVRFINCAPVECGREVLPN